MSDTKTSPLRKAREYQGFSREKVAAELAISSKTVERHEAFIAPVKRYQLEQYAELYKVPVGRLKAHLPQDVAA